MIARGIAPENALRIAYHLDRLAPEQCAAWTGGPIDNADFEALLAQGSLEMAADALMGRMREAGMAAHGRAPGSAFAFAPADAVAPLARVAEWTGFMLDRLDESPSLRDQAGASSQRSA